MMTNRLRSTLLAAGMLIGSAPALWAAGETELLKAVKARDITAVHGLIARHVDVNAHEADGTTPLHWAARAGDLAIVDVLIRAGAEANSVNRYGMSPLALAAANGSADVVGALLRAGADPRITDAALPEGQTSLMLAARTGNVETVKQLGTHGSNVNARESRTGTTALMWAAAEDRAAAVTALVELGADLNVRSRLTDYPHTPPGVIGDKLEPGVSYVGQTVLPKGGWTALMFAARQGAREAARALADAKAALDITDPDGSSALIFAIINGNYDVAKLLVEKGADANLADKTGATPLYSAVEMHTMATTFGRPDLPPLVVAGSVDAVKMLLAHGANPNATLKSKVLKRVYNAGDGKLDSGATALMRAAKGGDVTLMRVLLDAGADPTLAQKNGNSALLLAAALGPKAGSDNNPDKGTYQDAMAAMTMLLEMGADINASNVAGDTAAHAAVSSAPVLQFLADHGAKMDVKNKQGRTPLETALRGRDPNQQAVALLRQLTGDFTTQVPEAEKGANPRRRAQEAVEE
jgi:ankyrin repeat protein